MSELQIRHTRIALNSHDVEHNLRIAKLCAYILELFRELNFALSVSENDNLLRPFTFLQYVISDETAVSDVAANRRVSGAARSSVGSGRTLSRARRCQGRHLENAAYPAWQALVPK